MRHLPSCLALFALLGAMPSKAQRIEPRPQRPAGPAVVVTDLKIRVAVEGPGAAVEQRITLANRTRANQEFDLIFPLGPDEILTDVTLLADGKPVEGRIYPKDKAAAIYREITRAMRDPALLEHYGEGLFRARVAPIPPGASQELVLSFRTVPKTAGGLKQIRVPLTAWRRVAGPINLGLAGSIAETRPVTTLYSPTHELKNPGFREQAHARYPYRASFEVEVPGSVPELDFVLAYKTAPTDGGSGIADIAVLSDRPNPSEPGYFLAVLNGIANPDKRPEPKDVVFVIDRSGSMRGQKMDQAKEALKFLVERLGAEDRFNIVTYASTVDLYSGALLGPTPDGISGALRMVHAIEASGGTDIQSALSLALEQLKDSKRLSQIVFLTDGLPTVGETNDRKIVEAIRNANKTRTRIVAFGVGYDVNGAFLDRLAVQNYGLSEYVLPSENIEDKVPGFYSRMQSPLGIDLKLHVQGSKILDVYPSSLQDLYQGQQIIVTGRYLDSGPATFVLQGSHGGKPFAQEVRTSLSDASGDQLVPRIWAAKKIGYLVDEIRLGGESKELVDSIVELGTRFGILTEYTSFLAAPEVDLALSGELRDRGRAEFSERAKVEGGSHGVAQAANSKVLQRDANAARPNEWIDSDGKLARIDTVINANGQTFFKKGDTWLQAGTANEAKPDREVALFSDECFAILEGHPWLNRCIARTHDLTVKVGNELIRFRMQE